MPDIFITNNKLKNHGTKPQLVTAGENHVHMLSSFCRNPKGMSFQNQEPNEIILLFLRRHLITNVPWIFTVILLSIIPIILIILSTNFPGIFVFDVPGSYITIGLIFYYLIVFAYAFISFIDWYYNISLVTNDRVVDIDYSNIVYHDVAVTKLNLIEDTNYTQTGFIRSLFDYGDVFVQTAGEKENFDFLAVPHPADAVDIIENLIGGPR